MSTKIIAAVVIASAIAVAVLAVGSYISAQNTAVRLEQSLDADYVNTQNVLGQCTLKVQEVAQVPSMYAEDLKGVVTGAVEGRYGAGGSKAVMQWIQEAQIPFDSSLYKQLAQVLDSCRENVKQSQTKFIDRKRVYQTALGSFWSGFWMKQAGFPTVDLAKYKPVVAADTAAAFETGVQAPIKLR